MGFVGANLWLFTSMLFTANEILSGGINEHLHAYWTYWFRNICWSYLYPIYCFWSGFHFWLPFNQFSQNWFLNKYNSPLLTLLKYIPVPRIWSFQLYTRLNWGVYVYFVEVNLFSITRSKLSWFYLATLLEIKEGKCSIVSLNNTFSV